MPVWQELHRELKDKNFEVITVACDVRPQAAEPSIKDAAPEYPSLIDNHHVAAQLYNTRNVPTTVLIDENGEIVRYDEGVYLRRRNRETGEFTINERYLSVVRDWVEKGAASRYVLSGDEAQKRLRPLTKEDAEGIANFRMGVYLYEQGHGAEAVPYFKQANELKPENWNFKRQSFNLGNPEEDYGTTIQKEGQIRPMYVPLDMPSLPGA